MPSMALTPRNGMLPCAMRPRAVTSNQYTPRWPMQMRSTLSGSGMIDEIGARPAQCRPMRGQVRDAGEAAALFVHRAADLERARQRDAGARDRFRGEHRRGDAGLHVADAAAVDPAVAHHAAERIARVQPSPAGTTSKWPFRWTAGPAPPRRVPTTLTRGMRGGVLGTAVGGEVLDVEAAPLQDRRRESARTLRTPRPAG